MMKKDKKGVELTLNAVIVGVLILIVLVVLVLILTGSFEKIVRDLHSLSTCEGRGGECSEVKCQPTASSYPYLGGCGKDTKYLSKTYCCIPHEGEGQ